MLYGYRILYLLLDCLGKFLQAQRKISISYVIINYFKYNSTIIQLLTFSLFYNVLLFISFVIYYNYYSMINFTKHKLNNGLMLLHQYDKSTSLAAVNILYKVGSRNEDPAKTGFAHLFEHLMFGGSDNIPEFDSPLQLVGGENNAFTNSDFTNYYITLPVDNIETALWLESDRMLKLDFSEKSLEVQRQVVIEEFNQRYLNQPYGDAWLLLRPLAYQKHPYSCATIGKNVSHIENATIGDVEDFFYSHYAPNNAIISIVGNIELDETIQLVEKWFGDIPARKISTKEIPVEPIQLQKRSLEVFRNVPSDLIYMTFHMGSRNSTNYYVCDLLSDLLSNGRSARLYQNLVKEKHLFSEVNAYITGDYDAGLFVLTGKLNPGTTMEVAESEFFNELQMLKDTLVTDYELQKVINKVESTFIYNNVDVLNRAMNLCHYQFVNDASMINTEMERYNIVTPELIKKVAQEMFTENNCSVLYYRKKKNDE